MGSLSPTTRTKALLQLLVLTLKMACYQTDEDNLVHFLGGFNQIFLVYLLLNIVVTVTFEGSGGGLGTVVPEDYDFELDTALAKSSGHSAVMACLVFLCLAATAYVMVARLLVEARRSRLSSWPR